MEQDPRGAVERKANGHNSEVGLETRLRLGGMGNAAHSVVVNKVVTLTWRALLSKAPQIAINLQLDLIAPSYFGRRLPPELTVICLVS